MSHDERCTCDRGGRGSNKGAEGATALPTRVKADKSLLLLQPLFHEVKALGIHKQRFQGVELDAHQSFSDQVPWSACKASGAAGGPVRYKIPGQHSKRQVRQEGLIPLVNLSPIDMHISSPSKQCQTSSSPVLCPWPTFIHGLGQTLFYEGPVVVI